MCGIAGIISLGAAFNEKEKNVAEAMIAVQRHRGPDDCGILHDQGCVIANARLKIIDLSDNARLPMPNEDRSVWIGYNGIVTNYAELKKDFRLEEKHRFRSESDTEVLLHLYEELGIGFLEHLLGHFAFCLYDKRIKKAFVVRDIFGLRPLFYMEHNNAVYFASELKSFFEIPGFSKEINREAIYDYFTLAYIPGRATPYKNVRELRNCELLDIDIGQGNYVRRKYHNIEYRKNNDIGFNEAAEKTFCLMSDSVRRNMIADVPVGLTFSGGVDTSSILALVKENSPDTEFHTFSIKMNESSYDESRFQRLMVEKYRTIHHEIKVSAEDVMEKVQIHMAYMDEPNADGAAIPFFILAEDAKKYVSVLLSGEGGDEVFNAYETHGAYFMRSNYIKHVPEKIRKAIKAIVRHLPSDYRKLSFDFILKRFTEGAELETVPAHIYWRHTLAETEKKHLMPWSEGLRATDSIFEKEFMSFDFQDELDKISLLDINNYFIDDLLVKNDRMIMAHSIEARYPLIDRRLQEFVGSLPSSYRVRLSGLDRRVIEKKAMEKLLPKEILKRKNMGLEMPHSIWFLDSMRPLLEKYLRKDHLERTGIFNLDMVERMVNAHMSGKKDYGRALWAIVMYVIWFELFIYNGDYKKYLNMRA